jgi:hypothetical protein
LWRNAGILYHMLVSAVEMCVRDSRTIFVQPYRCAGVCFPACFRSKCVKMFDRARWCSHGVNEREIAAPCRMLVFRRSFGDRQRGLPKRQRRKILGLD